MEQTHSTPEKLLPSNINAALLEVTKTVKKLGAIYVEETTALNNVDNENFLKIQEKKLGVVHEYQSNMSQMMARKSEVSKSSIATKKTLKEVHEQFMELSRKNLKSINRMQRCTEKLGNTLRNAAVRAAHKQNGYSYGQNGDISNSAKRKAVSTGLSETV